MNKKFIMEYIRHPRSVGAIAPSSSRLAGKMMEEIDFESSSCIVEYGPGTGVFTDEILKRRKKDTMLILIEYNEDFCRILREKYKNEENVFIIEGSAENIEEYLNTYGIARINYIISGLPFASLPKDMSERILDKTRMVLQGGGRFITFQYTKLKMPMIKNYFRSVKTKKEIFNLPPAYVLECSN